MLPLRRLLFLLSLPVGALIGPWLCFAVYSVVDSVWPHEHSSATESYLWGGVGGAVAARFIQILGGAAGAVALGAPTLACLLPPKHRPLALVVPGAIGLLSFGTLTVSLWPTAVHHWILWQTGFPLVASIALLIGGGAAWRSQIRSGS